MTEINPKMYHGIQVILTRLAVKAEQLIDNVTTTWQSHGCMCLQSMMGEKSLTSHSLAYGSTVALMVLVCNTTWAKSSDLWHEADNTLSPT